MDIAQFQALMKELYFTNDQERGINRTALWLGEEMGELFAELKKHSNELNKVAIGEEMADIYAWVASLANLLNIDLQAAVIKKYNNVCPRCNQKPCDCKRNLP